VGDFAVVSPGLPLCSDLLGVCDGGGGAVWGAAWGMDGCEAGAAMPSVSTEWVRPGGENLLTGQWW